MNSPTPPSASVQDPASTAGTPEADQSQTKSNPLPVNVKIRIIEDKIFICPHCKEEIHEKGIYWDLKSNIEYHRACGGAIITPSHQAMTPEAISNFRSAFGIPESVEVEVEQEQIISESLPKSVEERIYRRTRIPTKTGEIRPEPVLKKEGDNDPTKTSRGRGNYRGHKKRKMDADKKAHPERFREHIEFILDMSGCPVDVVMESAKQISDPTVTLEILDGLLKQDIESKDKIKVLHDTLACYVEGHGYECGPFYCRLNDEDGEKIVLERAMEVARRVKRYLPAVWIERAPDERTNLCCLTVIGESAYGERYKQALNNGCVRSVQ